MKPHGAQCAPYAKTFQGRVLNLEWEPFFHHTTGYPENQADARSRELPQGRWLILMALPA
jgi:hypothetical protein